MTKADAYMVILHVASDTNRF